MNSATSQLIQAFRNEHKIGSEFNSIALNWFIPTAELIHAHQIRANGPLFIGVNGSQGSGKSTLTDFIQSYLGKVHKLKIAVVSLDDFYHCRATRLKLSEQVHPLLSTRGVPGTHDTELMQSVLAKLKQGKSTKLPRFNKATDDPYPESCWPEVSEPADIVILEGWCWGVMPQSKHQLATAVNKLEQLEDRNMQWRTYVNQQLASEYQPLYALFDFWLMLQAPHFSCVANWRKEQEHKLRLATNSSLAHGLMSDQQINRFIQHYQRLTEQSLAQMPMSSDLVFELDEARKIIAVTGTQVGQFNQIKQQRGAEC